jgi:hypothetical protein
VATEARAQHLYMVNLLMTVYSYRH